MKPGPDFPVDQVHADPAQILSNVIPKSPTDAEWDAVKSDYRSGLTYSKLSEKHGIPIPALVARRKAEGWRKDLREDVKAETYGRLALDSVPLGSQSDDEAVVQAAARIGAQVVRRHRDALGAHVKALGTVSAALARITAAIEKGKEPEARDIGMLGPKETLGMALLAVGNAYARVVPLERIAYGLNDRQDEKPYEERLREFYAAKQGERRQRANLRLVEARKEVGHGG